MISEDQQRARATAMVKDAVDFRITRAPEGSTKESTFSSLLCDAMEIAEAHMPHRDGVERKQWVLQTLSEAVQECDDTVLNREQMDAFVRFIDSIAPGLVDEICRVAKGLRNINTIAKSCWGSMCGVKRRRKIPNVI